MQTGVSTRDAPLLYAEFVYGDAGPVDVDRLNSLFHITPILQNDRESLYRLDWPGGPGDSAQVPTP